MGPCVRMGRRNLFPGRLNGSRTAQILPESPGRQRPTTEPAAAACEGGYRNPGGVGEAWGFFAAAPVDARPHRVLPAAAGPGGGVLPAGAAQAGGGVSPFL